MIPSRFVASIATEVRRLQVTCELQRATARQRGRHPVAEPAPAVTPRGWVHQPRPEMLAANSVSPKLHFPQISRSSAMNLTRTGHEIARPSSSSAEQWRPRGKTERENASEEILVDSA